MDYTSWETEPFSVNAVAALCPIINFNTAWAQMSTKAVPWYVRPLLKKAMKNYLGGSPLANPELTRQANADSYVNKNAPPFYLQHGVIDPGVLFAQSEAFAKVLRAKMGDNKVTLHRLENVVHAGGGPDFLEEENIMPILEFFKKNRKV